MDGGGGGVGLEVRLEAAGRHLSLALPCSGSAAHPAPPYLNEGPPSMTPGSCGGWRVLTGKAYRDPTESSRTSL